MCEPDEASKLRATLAERISHYEALIRDEPKTKLKASAKKAAARRLALFQRKVDKLQHELAALPPTPVVPADLRAIADDCFQRLEQIHNMLLTELSIHKIPGTNICRVPQELGTKWYRLVFELHSILSQHSGGPMKGPGDSEPALFHTYDKSGDNTDKARLSLAHRLLLYHLGKSLNRSVTEADILSWDIEGTRPSASIPADATSAAPSAFSEAQSSPAAPPSPPPPAAPTNPTNPTTPALRRREASPAGGAWTLVRKPLPKRRPRESRRSSEQGKRPPPMALPYTKPPELAVTPSEGSCKVEPPPILSTVPMPSQADYDLWMEDECSQTTSSYRKGLESLRKIVTNLEISRQSCFDK